MHAETAIKQVHEYHGEGAVFAFIVSSWHTYRSALLAATCSMINLPMCGLKLIRLFSFLTNMDLFYKVNLLSNTQLEPIAKGYET